MSKPFVCPADMDEQGQVRLDMPRAQYLAVCKARFAGKRVDIEIRERKSKRSLQANAAFHAGLYEWAVYRGLAGPAAAEWVEQIKDDLLALQHGYLVRQNQLTGEVIKSLAKPHTSDLNVQDFCDLFDAAIVEASKDGHVWRLPEEVKELKAQAAKQAARKAKAA